MLRGLWKLTWLEIKIFLREPLGAFGTLLVPVLVFLVVGRIVRPQTLTGLTRRKQFHEGGFTGPRVDIDRGQHRAVAGDDHFDLPRGWNP